jgi:hypothetical protein
LGVIAIPTRTALSFARGSHSAPVSSRTPLPQDRAFRSCWHRRPRIRRLAVERRSRARDPVAPPWMGQTRGPLSLAAFGRDRRAQTTKSLFRRKRTCAVKGRSTCAEASGRIAPSSAITANKIAPTGCRGRRQVFRYFCLRNHEGKAMIQQIPLSLYLWTPATDVRCSCLLFN